MKHLRHTLPLISACALALFHPAVDANEIYKTVDEDGNVTYSQTPMSVGETEKLFNSITGPTEAGAAASQQRKDQVSEYLTELDRVREEEAEQEWRRQAAQPPTYIQSNSWFLPTPVYHPWGRPRVHHYRGPYPAAGHSGYSSSVLDSRSSLSPPRDSWGRTQSYTFD